MSGGGRRGEGRNGPGYEWDQRTGNLGTATPIGRQGETQRANWEWSDVLMQHHTLVVVITSENNPFTQ